MKNDYSLKKFNSTNSSFSLNSSIITEESKVYAKNINKLDTILN